MMLRSSTVTQIDRIQTTEIPPALCDVYTTGGEHFPIFDPDTLQAALLAYNRRAHVLLSMGYAAKATYIRAIHVIDVTANSIPCPDCTAAYEWNQRDVPGREPGTRSSIGPPPPMRRLDVYDINHDISAAAFICDRCLRRIFLTPPKAVPVELPTVARARLNRTTDGLFALDHLHQRALLLESIPGETAQMPPYQGVHAELEPFDPDFVLDHHAMIPYRHVKLKTPLALRLQGEPFRGRDVYEVI